MTKKKSPMTLTQVKPEPIGVKSFMQNRRNHLQYGSHVEFTFSGGYANNPKLDEHYLSDGTITRIDEVSLIFEEAVISVEEILSVDFSERAIKAVTSAQ